MIRGLLLLGWLLGAAALAYGENLLHDASFEHDAPGIVRTGYNRYGPLRDATATRLASQPPEAAKGADDVEDLLADEQNTPALPWRRVRGAGVAWHGQTALLGNLKDSLPLQLEVAGGAYVFSVYARASGTDVLQLRVEDIRGRKGEIRHDQKKAFTLGTEWQRCAFPVQVVDGPVTLFLELLGKGTVWVDAVQFEAGTEATAFALHPWEQDPPRELAAHGQPLYPKQIQRVDIAYVDQVLHGLAPPTWAGSAAPAGQAGSLPLTIARPADGVPGPASGGIPLPVGQLFDPAHADVVDSQGASLGPQLRVLSRHVTDGSVQMLLIDLPPLPPETACTLRYGPAVQRPAATSPLQVAETAEAITVTTGPLAFTVPRGRGQLFSRLAWDANGDGTFSADEELLTARPEQGPFTADGLGRLYWGSGGAPETVTVEEAGPVRVSIHVAGWHREPGGRALFRYSVRLHATAGSAALRLEHTFSNEQQPYATVLGGAGVRFAFAPGVFARATLGEGPALTPAADETLAVLDGQQLLRLRGPKVTTSKYAPSGWLTLSGPRVGLTALIREWPWMPPKEYAWHPTEGLDLCVWPRHLTGGLAVPAGLARSHRLWLDFHGPDLPAAQLAARRATLLGDTLVQAAPAVYCNSTVFGKLAIKDAERFPEVEHFIARPGEGTFGRFPRPGEYAWHDFIHYGDDRGDMGFGNLETMLDHCMWLLYVRSLDPWYYRRAHDAALHYRDVDMCHPWGQTRVHSHNHTLTPWDCSHDWIKGLLEHYLLTGDNRSLEVAHEYGRWLLSVPTSYKVSTGSRRWTRIVQNLADLYRITGQRAYYDSFAARIALAEELRGAQRDVSLFQLNAREDGKTSYGRLGMEQFYGLCGLEEMAKATGDARWRELLVSEMSFLLGDREAKGPLTDPASFAAWGREQGRTVSSGRHRLFYSLLGYLFELTGEQKYLDAALNAAFFETTRSDWKDWWPNQGWADDVLIAYGLYHAQELGLGAEDERELRAEAVGQGLPKAMKDPDFEATAMGGWAGGKEVMAAKSFSYMDVLKDEAVKRAGSRSLTIQETRQIGQTRELDRSKREWPLELTGNQFLVEQPGWYVLQGYVRFRKHGRPNLMLHLDGTASDARRVVDTGLPALLPRVVYPNILGLDGKAPAAEAGQVPLAERDATVQALETALDDAPRLDPEAVWWRFRLPFELTEPTKVRLILQYCYGLMPPGQVWFDEFSLEPLPAPPAAEAAKPAAVPAP
jgi:hypothetical protein